MNSVKNSVSNPLRILSLCDYTGNMLKPWAAAGHYCVAVDIAYHTDHHDGIWRLKRDVKLLRSVYPVDLAFDWIFAFPPCTDLASSGARWFESKGLGATIEALQLVQSCLQICETANRGWMIENPVGRLSSAWRKPDFKFDPCDYGDPYTKKTCLWVGGAFELPPFEPIEPVEGSKMHTKLRSQRARSETPQGFANAVFKHLAGKGGLCELSKKLGI